MTEADVKSRKPGVLIAPPDASVAACLDRMAAANVGSILIADEKGLHGILTERDTLRLWRQLEKPAFRDGPVMQMATKTVFSLTIDKIGDAPREMLERHIRHVPLVDAQGRVVGIVSMRDILAAQLKARTLPRLAPEPIQADKKAPGRVFHVVKPQGSTFELVSRLLPDGWTGKAWPSLSAFVTAPELAAPGALRGTGLMLDLDALDGEDWRPLVRRLIQTLTREDHPTVFLVASEERLAEKDIVSLKSVADKAHWRVYRRPLATASLQEDFKALAGEA